MSVSNLTAETIRALVSKMREQRMPTYTDSDGEHYALVIPPGMAQCAFDMGLAPFCPLDPDSTLNFARCPA